MGLGVHFIDSATVAATGEGGLQPGVHDFHGGGFRGGFASEAENVGGVVLAGDGGGGGITHEAGLDARVAVRGDAHADAGGAYEDACVGAAVEHALADEFSKVRVVHGGSVVGAEVLDAISTGLQMRHDGVFQGEAAMVGGDGELVWQGGVAHEFIRDWGFVLRHSRQQQGLSRFCRCRQAGWGAFFSDRRVSPHMHYVLGRRDR